MTKIHIVCFQRQKGAYLRSVSSCGAWYRSEALASRNLDMWHSCPLPSAQAWCASCSWTGWRRGVRRWDRERFHQIGADRAGWLLPALPLQQVEVEGRSGLRNFPAQCSCACHFYYKEIQLSLYIYTWPRRVWYETGWIPFRNLFLYVCRHSGQVKVDCWPVPSGLVAISLKRPSPQCHAGGREGYTLFPILHLGDPPPLKIRRKKT